jgi:hypothetical protein
MLWVTVQNKRADSSGGVQAICRRNKYNQTLGYCTRIYLNLNALKLHHRCVEAVVRRPAGTVDAFDHDCSSCPTTSNSPCTAPVSKAMAPAHVRLY